MIPGWMRRIPHPIYGFYGGQNRTCIGETCPLPIDKLDALFQKHDIACYHANQQDPEIKKKLKKLADKDLGRGLRTDLKPYACKHYGPIYRFLASLIFRP